MPLAPSITSPLLDQDGKEVTQIFSPSSPHKRFTAVPNNSEIKKHFVKVRRHLSDLPLPTKQMNLVSLVCMYTLMGLTDLDIAIAAGSTEDRIRNIKMLDAYVSVYNQVTQGILDNEAADVSTILVNASKDAAQKMISLLDDEFSAVQLSAAKDILDRSGHRPVDVVLHQHSMDGELRISISREDKTLYTEVPLEHEQLQEHDKDLPN